MENYYVLEKNNISEYLIKLNILENNEEINSVEEIGNGNLNYVYLVITNIKKLIVKQSVPFLRIAGEGWPLSEDRMKFEIMSYNEYSNFTPEYIPTIFHSDTNMNVLIMEYLEGYEIFRDWIINSKDISFFKEKIVQFLVTSLYETSIFSLNNTQRDNLLHSFSNNTDLCKLSEEFIFTFPFMEEDSNDFLEHLVLSHKEILTDSEYKNNVLELKYNFITKKEALLHGDLHNGSIMVDGTNIKVIDTEFSFYGPIAFDVGKVVGNLIMSRISHINLGNEKYANEILDSIEYIINNFFNMFKTKLIKNKKSTFFNESYIKDINNTFVDKYLKNLLQDVIGFAGVVIGRRTFGIAGVAEIRGLEKGLREIAEKESIEISKKLVKNYKEIDSIEKFIKEIK